MKKLFAILSASAIMASCGDSSTSSSSESDSARAAATADSMNAAKALGDTSSKMMDEGAAKMDTAAKSVGDTLKK